MNNFKFSGKRITVTPTVPVAAGVLCRIQGFIGIPINNCLAGQSVSFAIEGVFGMTFAAYGGGTTVAVGTIIYWDTTGAALSIGAANDDYPAVKAVTAVSSSNGSFQGLLLPQGNPYGQEQS